jgi:hypothetical protein
MILEVAHAPDKFPNLFSFFNSEIACDNKKMTYFDFIGGRDYDKA